MIVHLTGYYLLGFVLSLALVAPLAAFCSIPRVVGVAADFAS